MSIPSCLELATYRYLTYYPFRKPPHPKFWATEVAAFHKHPQLEKCKVDVVICDRLSASTEDMKCSIMVFLDGKGHFPWSSGNRQGSNRCGEAQRATDKSISIAAASAGFKILRVAQADVTSLLRMIELVWTERGTTHGWVKVSRQWNVGTHRKAAVKV